MKVEFGDLVEILKGGNVAVAHGVNCQGAMGSGIARQLSNVVPYLRSDYIDFCKDTPPRLLLGKCQLVSWENNAYVFNCFTQEHYGYNGDRYASPLAIRKSLRIALEKTFNLGLDTLYIPMIGAGLGGLSESEVIRSMLLAEAEANIESIVELKLIILQG